MKNIIMTMAAAAAFSVGAQAQTDNTGQPRRYPTVEEVKLEQEASEVQNYASWLAQLKTAFSERDMGKIAVCESAVLMALRLEINQLAAVAGGEYGSTSDRSRLEVMRRTLVAFDGHAFDPVRPENADRDFAMLDNVLVLMQEALAEIRSRK
ncbi:MAG: hypothetical protein ACKO4W_00515 [Bacteroidota bacterium]